MRKILIQWTEKTETYLHATKGFRPMCLKRLQAQFVMGEYADRMRRMRGY